MSTEITPQSRIVPTQNRVGQAFVLVIAIMTFLACLCVGISACVYTTVQEWDRSISRDVTVQIRQIDGTDSEKTMKKALDILRATKGIKSATPISEDQQKELLAPWLGSGIDTSLLDLPKMVAVETLPELKPDIAALAQKLSTEVPGASLDDHRGWRDKLHYSATLIFGACFVVFLLVILAAAFTIIFATRGTLASCRHVVDILDMLGAPHSFIANEFQKEYFRFGLRGAALGGLLAIALFAGFDLMGAAQISADVDLLLPIGNLSVGWPGYAALAGMIFFVAILTALISRYTALSMLDVDI